jgi:hypothetical protein
MVPLLERVAEPYGISVVSGGGCDSLTVKHRAGLLLGRRHPVEVLHIGHWDDSGECMYDALSEDIEAFADHYHRDLTFSRLAVTPEQVAQYNLPTAPPKKGKNGKENTRQLRKKMTATVQAEALDPATLAQTLEAAIQSRFDMDVFEQVIAQEAKEREELKAQLTEMTA